MQATASTSCCSALPSAQPSNNEAFWIDLIKKVARVAALAIAAYFFPVVTAICFTVGFAIGVTAVLFFEEMIQKGERMQLCILGYTEFSTDTKFPAIFNTCITALFLFDCLSHGSPYFCGFISGGVGFWMGKEMTVFLKDKAISYFASSLEDIS